MPLKANDCHNHLKLKIKAQICYFLLFISVFFKKMCRIPIKKCLLPASRPLFNDLFPSVMRFPGIYRKMVNPAFYPPGLHFQWFKYGRKAQKPLMQNTPGAIILWETSDGIAGDGDERELRLFLPFYFFTLLPFHTVPSICKQGRG